MKRLLLILAVLAAPSCAAFKSIPDAAKESHQLETKQAAVIYDSYLAVLSKVQPEDIRLKLQIDAVEKWAVYNAAAAATETALGGQGIINKDNFAMVLDLIKSISAKGGN